MSSIKDKKLLCLLTILSALVGGFAVVLGKDFFSSANLQSIAFQLPELGILTLAMMITMLTGGINLSIIAAANMSGIATAWVLTSFMPGSSISLVMGLLAGVVVSLCIGVINGWLVAYVGVSAILATLGTMTLVEGISVLLTQGSVISGFPDGFLFIGNGTIYGIPVPLIIFLLCALFVGFSLERTPFGVYSTMIGSNSKAAEFSGVPVKRVLVWIYVLSGLLAGVAATIMISRFNSARAGYASSYLLVTVLASVLGGVNPDGGFGRVGGVVLALVILQVISSGLNLLGLSSHLGLALWGAILIAVMVVPVLNRKNRPD